MNRGINNNIPGITQNITQSNVASIAAAIKGLSTCIVSGYISL
ncbi:MAG: hypothetical protein ACFFA4_02540 [Promethearchaeota archaeon]